MGKYARVGLILVLLALVVLLGRMRTGSEDGPPPVDPDVNTAVVPASHLERDPESWFRRHQDVLRLGREKTWDLVFIGDSITQFFGGSPRSAVVRGGTVWREYYGRRRALNLGFGWDRTQNVLWRLRNGELDGVEPKVAVILIGTNNLSTTSGARRNTTTQIAAGVEAILGEIAGRTSGCRVVLSGLLPRRTGASPAEIRDVNRRLAELAAAAGAAYVDPTDRFAGPDGRPRAELMHDDIHPNDAGYRAWAELLEPLLAVALAEKVSGAGGDRR